MGVGTSLLPATYTGMIDNIIYHLGKIVVAYIYNVLVPCRNLIVMSHPDHWCKQRQVVGRYDREETAAGIHSGDEYRPVLCI